MLMTETERSMTSLSQPQAPPLYTPHAKNLALVLLAMTQ